MKVFITVSKSPKLEIEEQLAKELQEQLFKELKARQKKLKPSVYSSKPKKDDKNF